MNDISNIMYHEIDFLLPSHRFNISFSYVTKKSLPFIREFFLRLIHLAPMKPYQLATYFGLSKREVSVALSDLLEKGDVKYLDDGLVALTKQSQAYFTDLGSIPEVAVVLQTGGIFGFELESFNFTGTKRTNEKWLEGIVLDVSNENKGLSEKLAKKHFQSQFYSLLDDGYLKQVENNDKSGRPSIYKMESVNKIGQVPVRITQEFCIDTNGLFIERDDIEQFDDSSDIVELITKSIHHNRVANNLEEIENAMETLNDSITGDFISNSGVDIVKLLTTIESAKSDGSVSIPFIGPIYSKFNWETFINAIDPILDTMNKEHQESVDEFVWVAPSDNFWGQSKRLSSSFGELIDKAKRAGKKPKTLFKPKMYVPMYGTLDRQTKNKWKNNLSKDVQYVHGLVEGFLGGNVEIIILPDRIAAVCYHLIMPEMTSVSVPLGFITTDKSQVHKISKLVNDYKSGLVDSETPNDLGGIS